MKPSTILAVMLAVFGLVEFVWASCGSCSNCYYAPTSACFSGWTADQCAQVAQYTWCGSNGAPQPNNGPPPPSSGSCGSCNNCYYAPTSACFAGWTAAQCAQVPQYTWCGSNGVPRTFTPWPVPNSPSTFVPSPSGNFYVSWNWFNSNTLDCDGRLSPSTLNSGFYVGGENIPADCGKTATFTYNGHTVTATYAWKTGGGLNYHELSPQAFAKLLGSSANAANFGSAPQFQAAINDPGHVTAQCAGSC
ncbi:Aste57867_3539 [Aphanomyces stellatus]|uniref:Aste57867_3539 protein n=1 Tax=Aphanomyces stellatus TaxID=120398 RepID=A0A485KFD8_9STRA|nr:hypothetical protein As57867_003528 [Aphanomyces stellatus]VFT80702.1 Aste57867_3539 [Aphanomyces stellatus]